MAPGICWTRAATPGLPRPPMAWPGQLSVDLLALGHFPSCPQLLFSSWPSAWGWLMKGEVVAVPSARWTTVIGVLGRLILLSLLSSQIAGSFQRRILFRKMPRYVLRDSRTGLFTPSRL